MDNPVTVEHVEARFRSLSDPERLNAEAWIEDAWEILTERRPELSDDLDAENVSVGSVVRTVCNMVIRKLQNPDGKSKESIDDYSFERDRSIASGDLYVKDSELFAVTPSSSRRITNSVRLVAYGES